MKPSDKPAFAAVLNGLAAIKPGKGLTAEALEIWWAAMQSWDIEDFRAAASHLAGSVEFMPNPFHFTRLRTSFQLTAGEAWERVLRGDTLEPGSREYRAACIAGGQYAIRHANLERDVPHIQRRFCEAYEELGDVDTTRAALPQIAASSRVRLRGPGQAADFLPDLRDTP